MPRACGMQGGVEKNQALPALPQRQLLRAEAAGEGEGEGEEKKIAKVEPTRKREEEEGKAGPPLLPLLLQLQWRLQ